MGLNYRRSIKIGSHTRLNLSKSGIGISTGVKGARVSVGPHGVRKTVGIPGTGIYYTKQSSYKKSNAPKAKYSNSNTVVPRRPLSPVARFGYKFLAVVCFIIAAFLFFCGIAVLSCIIFFWIFAAVFVWLGIRCIKWTKSPNQSTENSSDTLKPPSELTPEEFAEQTDRVLRSADETLKNSPVPNMQTSEKVPDLSRSEIDTKVVGVTHGKRQEYLEECYDGQEITIKHDKNNKYSSHALAVYAEIDGSNKVLGYLNDGLASELYSEYIEPFEDDEDLSSLDGYITELTGGTEDKPIRGCNIKIMPN